MALIINTPITTPSGIVLTTSYARVKASTDLGGIFIYADMTIYSNKQSFINNLEEIRVPYINIYKTAQYDRTTDSSDILDLAHDVLIASLLEQGIVATKDLI